MWFENCIIVIKGLGRHISRFLGNQLVLTFMVAKEVFGRGFKGLRWKQVFAFIMNRLIYNTPSRFRVAPRSYSYARERFFKTSYITFGAILFLALVAAVPIDFSSLDRMLQFGTVQDQAIHAYKKQYAPASSAFSKESLRSLVRQVSKQELIPAELLWAVISVESSFDPEARSHAGAMGLMQLMPATASELQVVDPYDPRDNVQGGAKYLRKLLERFDGNKELALAAYNAGPGTVRRYNGIPPYKETQQYVRKVMSLYRAERAKRAFSFT